MMAEMTTRDEAGLALDELFEDVSVPARETREALQALRDKIDGMIEALDDDVRTK